MKHKLAGFLCCFLATVSASFGQGIVIHEIMYHPSTETVVDEYIELYNVGVTPVNLQGWQFTKGVDFVFTNSVVIQPGAYVVVAANLAAFQVRYPGVSNVVGNWTGMLSNQGEDVELVNAAGETIDVVEYADEGDWGIRRRGLVLGGTRGWEWFAAADGVGPSLELRNPLLSNDYAQNWAPSATNTIGTPGRQNTARLGDVPPIITGVQHFPLVPHASNEVTVTARLVDEAPARISASVRYRTLSNPFNTAPMFDDGQHNDGVANDGIYGAILPRQDNGVVVEFYVQATDGESVSTWPAPAVDEFGIPVQTANAQYQVDESVYGGRQAVVRLIMTEQERLIFQNINRQSDAQMNATLLIIDGTSARAIYNAGLRIRGAGSRGAAVPNYRVNIPSDRLWNDLSAINLNAQYGHAQVAGSALALKSGLLASEARPVQVRVNGVNLASTAVQNGFGSYALVEPVNDDLAENHIPNDADGNVYRASTGNHSADLSHPTPATPARYMGLGYSKTSNATENDWTDLTNLTYRLDPNYTSDANYVQAVTNVVNVREWMAYFAIVTLTGYDETSLGTGRGDDFALYRGIVDPRFSIISHDFDTILAQGQGGAGTTRDIWYATSLPIINRFMRHPAFAPIYFEVLQEMIDTTFSPEELNPLLTMLLAEYVPQSTITSMQQYGAARRDYVASQIPTNITISSSLPLVNGFRQSSSATVNLNGRANAIRTRSIRVNGVTANWTAWQANWTISNLRLNPGINRVLVQSLDGNGVEFERSVLDIWYNDGSVAGVSGSLGGTTTWTPAAGPYNVTANVTIPADATLVIQPGTTVYFAQGTTLTVNGRMVAEGNPTNRIRLTRDPASGNTWGGLRFNNSTQDNRLSYIDIEFANAGNPILLSNSALLIDHASWSNTTQNVIELDNSSLHVRDSVFPNLPGREHIHGGPIPAGGYVIVEGNLFGTTTGLNDIIDFKGARRPGPVLQILNNVFTGASDDVLDLDGTDAHVEGNIFMRVHNGNFGAPDTASAISAGQDAGYGPQIVAVRNLFLDVDHVALVKEGAFISLENNTALGIGVAAVNFSEPERNTVPGTGAYLDGNIFWNTPSHNGTNFQNQFPTNGSPVVIAHRNIFPVADGITNGIGNLTSDPRLVRSVTNGISYLTISNDLQLLSGSPAQGTGPNGLDRGAFVPQGPSLLGVPVGTTSANGAAITVGGPGIVSYLYRLNNGSFSAEAPVSEQLVLSNLATGTNRVEVQGRNSAGILLTNHTAVRSWVVDPSFSRLVLNEIIARNESAIVHADTFPDVIELYNAGGQAFDLAGIGLTDDTSKRHLFTFPAGTMLAPGQYMIVYADAETTPGFHTGFGLDQNGDTLYLYDKVINGATLLDSVAFGPQLSNLSIGRQGEQWTLNMPTFGSANVAQPLGSPELVRINEWLADGQSGFLEDFIELYNPDTLPVQVGGFYLSDEPMGDPAQHRIAPLTFIGARGHLALVADGEPDLGANHLNFKLSAQQGRIGLFDSNLNLLECVIYDQQFSDVSFGRRPSGSETFSYFGPFTQTQPTPGAPNPGRGGVSTVTNIVHDLLPLATTWRYDSSGVDRGTTWRTSGFNDNNWNSGPALLGFESATLPPPGLNTSFSSYDSTQVTYYFRSRFVLTNDLTGFNLAAHFVLDDGAVVYVNGTELLRVRMPNGTITFFTEALGPSVNNATLETFIVPASGLVMGTNVLAVEVHQATLPSSDIVFGFGLQATRTITNTPTVQVTINEVMANNETVLTPGTTGDTNITDWIELFNAADVSFDLSGMSLSDSLSDPLRWVFPPGTSIGAGGYLIVRCDPNSAPATTAGGILNTGFGLSGGGDAAYLFDRSTNGGIILDSIQFGIQAADFSIGRVPNANGAWTLTLPTVGAVNLAANLGATSNLKVNEWLASPSGNDEDYFEIFNPNPQPVDIGGLFLTDTLTDRTKYKVPVLSFIGIGDNAFALFTADSNPGSGADHTNFRLGADGESVGIFNAAGTQIDGISFGPQANGVSEGRFPDGAPSIARFIGTKTPGRKNLLPLQDVVINEVLTHTDGALEDAIELYNPTAGFIDISGWYLSDDEDNPTRFRIPNGTVLSPGGFAVFYEYQFNPDFTGRAPAFALSAANGDEVFLSTADADGKLSGFRAQEDFGPAKNGVSFGTYQTSVGIDFIALRARTFGSDTPGTVQQFRTGTGATNALPKIGPVIIEEIMYHPSDPDGVEDVNGEFIELANITALPVPLFDPAYPTNTWRLRDAVGFVFPMGITLAPNERILVVGFDSATNASVEVAFRSRYNVPAGVRIFGPFDGRLNNAGDSVEVTEPDEPQPLNSDDPGFVPYVLVERINYSDLPPWPLAADGETNGVRVSLQRRVGSEYGNDPVNWLAGAATAGTATGPSVSGLPVITTPPASQTVAAGMNVILTVQISGPGPFVYQWRRDGFVLPGATNTTLLIPNAQFTNSGLYTIRVSNRAGAALSNPALVTVQAPPVIITQPISQAVTNGATTIFIVGARGTKPLQHQWYKDGVVLPGATDASLVVSNIQTINEGSYHVVITNSFGSATSVVATLFINTLPSIVALPQGTNVFVGADVLLTVTAAGTPPLRYQWRRNGNILAEQTNATLSLPNAQVSDSGNYTVQVINVVGSVTSDPIPVEVRVPPTLSVLATDMFAAEPGSDTGTFTFTRGGSTNTAVTVSYTVSGAASPGADYTALPGSIQIAAGVSNVTLQVSPINDNTPEGDESVVVTLTSGSGYVLGAPATASVVIRDEDNVAPSVTLTNPVAGTSFVSGANVLLGATAGDSDGTVAKVSFFYNQTNLIGEVLSAPYVFTLSNAPAGQLSLTAVATDNLGSTAVSAPVVITVNALPTVAIASPAPNAAFTAPATITVSANAADADGSITQVEFFAGGTSIGLATNASGSTLTADYRFANNRDSTVTSASSLTDLGNNSFTTATVDGTSRTVLRFAANDGLTLPSAGSLVADDVFTIAILFRFDQVSSFRRLIDFRNGTSDNGLYVLEGGLTFYTPIAGPSGVFNTNAFVQVVLTRDSGGTVTAYINGVQHFSFVDTGDLATIDSSNVLRFFRDDGTEGSSGAIARLRIFNVALNAAQVAALDRLPGAGGAGATYSIVWPDVGPGNYTLTARATDNLGARATSGPVSISVSLPKADFSDNFGTRGVLTGMTNFVTGNNSTYTRETAEPRHDLRNGAHSAWISWTAPLTGSCTMDTLGSGFDTVLGVYTGTSLGSLLRITSGDDTGALLQSTVNFIAEQGVTYQIAVDGYGSLDAGAIVFHLSILSQAPTITTHPQNFTVNRGSPVTLIVAATGAAPLQYQWLFNGVAKTGATNATLNLSNIQAIDEGLYAAMVSNGSGVATSQTARVTVRIPPAFTAHPQAIVIDPGSNAVFAATLAGSTPFTYQWRYNGSPMANQTNLVLVLNNVHYTNSGFYSLAVGNVAGSANSDQAELIVRPRIVTGQKMPNGSFQLRIHGVPGTIYNVQGSTNNSSWNAVGSVTNSAVQSDFSDPPGTPQPWRFYRLLRMP